MSEDPSLSGDSSAAAEQDLAWMARIKTGDTEALEQLIEAHQHRVLGAITKMLGDETEAEDLAQQVFLRVWKSAPRYEPTAKFTTWLYKILRNLVFNELRRRQRHRTTSLHQPPPGEDETIAPDPHDPAAKAPDRQMVDDEMQSAIQKAIDSLPETQRMAIILRRYDEFSYEEIAEIMELSIPAVKSVLFRARGDLREKLRQYLEE